MDWTIKPLLFIHRLHLELVDFQTIIFLRVRAISGSIARNSQKDGWAMASTTKGAVMDFVAYAINKGLVNANTGGGWRSAASRILEDYADSDDIGEIDVPTEVLRYNNRHPGLLSPDSLNQYQKRVVVILNEFKKWQASPTTYRGVSRGAVVKGEATNGKKETKRPSVKALPAPEPTAAAPEPAQHKLGAITDSSLMVPFPLRSNFVVQFIVPRDMTKEEAARLCAFISALGHDPKVVAE